MDDAISVDDRCETDKAPNPSQMVLVECDGVRHVATQDQFGKWRTLSRHKELLGQVEVISVVRERRMRDLVRPSKV